LHFPTTTWSATAQLGMIWFRAGLGGWIGGADVWDWLDEAWLIPEFELELNPLELELLELLELLGPPNPELSPKPNPVPKPELADPNPELPDDPKPKPEEPDEDVEEVED